MNKKIKNIFKLIITLLITIISINSSNAIKPRKSSRSKSTTKFVPTNNTSEIKEEEIIQSLSLEEETISSYDIDLSSITNNNCEKTYSKCMNKTCYKKGQGRCPCSQDALSVLTSLDDIGKDSNIGLSLYKKQDKVCSKILEKCPMMKKKISVKYKAQTNQDCSEYTINHNNNNKIENKFALLEDLKICMKEVCKQRYDDPDYIGCFNTSDAIEKFNLCSNVLKKARTPESLKTKFIETMQDYKVTYCNRLKGDINSEGLCGVKVAYGRDVNKIVKEKMFYTGDTIDCSEKGFGVELGQDNKKKKYYAFKIAAGGLKLVGDVIGIVSSVKGAGNAEGFKGKAMAGIGIAGGALGALQNVGDVAGNVVGLLIDKDVEYTGYCYINRVPVMGEGTMFKLKYIDK